MSDKLPFPEINGNELSKRMFDFQYKKSLVKENAKKLAQVYEGDKIAAYINATVLSEWCDTFKKEIKEDVIESLERNNGVLRLKEGMEHVGLSIGRSAKKYDFSHDKVWNELNEKLKEIKLKIKEREDLMVKALSFSGVCDENGEVIEPAKVLSEGTDYVTVRY